MLVRRLSIIVLALIATLPVVAQPTAAADDVNGFSAGKYLAHIKYLASDELQGRLPGTPGIEAAAQYIADQFQAAGLSPAGDNGTWFQEFEVRRGKKFVETEAQLVVDGLDQACRLRQDWVPMPFSGMDDADGPLAFAGYGIEADLHHYNDYQDFDATGKILLIFRFEPKSDDPDADFGGKEGTHYSEFRTKAQTAARHGAAGLLIVNPPLREGLSDDLYEFNEEYARQTYDLPLAHITKELAETLLKQAGLPDLTTLQTRLDHDHKPLSQDMKLQVHLKPGVCPNLIKTRNVVGMLRGDGTTDDILAFGGHYDHLGLVPLQFDRTDDTPQIHNGADDNASGTAGVIELARVLGADGGWHHNLLFITFSAEEMGLLGSEHFAEHPTVPRERIRALINFDMIGRLQQDKFTVYGVPSATEFADIVARAGEQVGLTYRRPDGLSGNSDHASFFRHGIPYLFPFTGVHKDYHRPSDDWELIDAPGAVRILQMFRLVTHDLDALETGPTLQEQQGELSGEDAVMKPASEHEEEADKDKQAGGRPGPAGKPGDPEVGMPTRPQVRLGIIPDFAGSDGPGMGVDTVLDNGPAKAAGLQAGDRIIRIGETKIQDIYAYMATLKTFKAGDELDIVVVRDGKEVTLKVKLTKAHPKRHAR